MRPLASTVMIGTAVVDPTVFAPTAVSGNCAVTMDPPSSLNCTCAHDRVPAAAMSREYCPATVHPVGLLARADAVLAFPTRAPVNVTAAMLPPELRFTSALFVLRSVAAATRSTVDATKP